MARQIFTLLDLFYLAPCVYIFLHLIFIVLLYFRLPSFSLSLYTGLKIIFLPTCEKMIIISPFRPKGNAALRQLL
jgi:hypothetical protein